MDNITKTGVGSFIDTHYTNELYEFEKIDSDILKDAVRFRTIHVKTFLTSFFVQFEKPGLVFRM